MTDRTFPAAANLQGLWQRTNLTRANGTVDDTTFVRWAQVGHHYIDIRIPDEDAGTDFLDRKGFAGAIEAGGGICEWFRAIDFHPPTGSRDVARVELSGDTLHEVGSPDVGSPDSYNETFIRIKTGATRSLALECRDSMALFLVIDDAFFYARRRSEALPQHPTLRDYVATGGDMEQVCACEISMGEIDIGQQHLIISHSVNPARQGKPLFPDAKTDQHKWRLAHGAVDKVLRPYLPAFLQDDV